VLEKKKNIDEDIKAGEMAWPIELPIIRKNRRRLIGSSNKTAGQNFPGIFNRLENFMILLHGIIKKSQKTPYDDLELAKKRRNNVLKGGYDEND